jgi:hypothetical protein
MRLVDHVTLNFNNLSTAAVFLDIEKAFVITWHPGLLYKPIKLIFSVNTLKLISSFLSDRNSKFRLKVNFPRLEKHKQGCPKVPSCPVLYNLYINYAPQTPGTYLALFADDTCIFATDRKEGYVVRKLQRGLSFTELRCEHWNVNINEEKTQAIYFSRGNRPAESHLTLKERKIPFVNQVKYLGVIFDRKVTWRYHIDMIVAKAFRTFIRVYSLFKTERLSANIKLTPHRALIRSIMTYACPTWEFVRQTPIC